MTQLGRQLLEHSEEIIDRWYRDWTASDHPHEEVPVTLLRDNLAEQLRIIGRSLESDTPEVPSEMWEVAERLHPEERVEQHIPIEEEVLSYKILVSVVREWVEENEIEVTSRHYGFFYETIFELVAESVKRYTRYRESQVREDRSRHVAAIAHQMKTPIATLSIAAQLLAQDSTIEPEILDPMRRAVRRLELMTGGLMRLERFRAEEIPVRPATIRVENLVAEIVEYHHAPARGSGVEIIRIVDPDLEIVADPDLCTDAIDNLVHNAVRHGAPGTVRVHARREDGVVLFEVIDEGPGIDVERQKKLFTPVLPAKGGGAGLGLTIARRAVVAQSGEIGFESEPGRGCRFWLRLPFEVGARS